MTYSTFPIDSKKCAYGTKYTASWNVAEKTSANGTRRAVTHQMMPAWKFQVKYPMLTEAEVESVLGFYNKCKGSLTPFYWQDAVIGKGYTHQKLIYNSTLDGMQFMHHLGGYADPCPKVTNITNLTSNGFAVDYEYHESGSVCYVAFEGSSSILLVYADYKAYWLVKFASAVTVEEKFDNYYSISLTLEVVR